MCLLTRLSDLVRVIKRGPDVKRLVDDAIDQCDQFLNVGLLVLEATNCLSNCFGFSATGIDRGGSFAS